MTLEKELARTGHFLFRWRGCLPVVLALPTLLAMREFQDANDSHVQHEAWVLFSMAVSFFGLGVRAVTIGYTPKGTSGRNTRRQRASVLNTTGMYSVVRHPLYLGNAIIWLGVSMFCQTWWLTVIFILAFWIYYERIMMAEEEFLREEFGDAYLDWASRTPAFIPAPSRWRRPDLPFSLRKVLRREYTGFFAIVACFFVLESTRHVMVYGQLVFEPHWAVIFLAGLLVYATLRTLKKRTHLLVVEGR
ncbi:MAG: isoprenylcysteine carboxylmethyltransferase family protein [Planctomycetota bacterium]